MRVAFILTCTPASSSSISCTNLLFLCGLSSSRQLLALLFTACCYLASLPCSELSALRRRFLLNVLTNMSSSSTCCSARCTWYTGSPPRAARGSWPVAARLMRGAVRIVWVWIRHPPLGPLCARAKARLRSFDVYTDTQKIRPARSLAAASLRRCLKLRACLSAVSTELGCLPRGQRARFDADTYVLIVRLTRLVEPPVLSRVLSCNKHVRRRGLVRSCPSCSIGAAVSSSLTTAASTSLAQGALCSRSSQNALDHW